MILANAAATHAAGQSLAARLRAGDVVALSGELGAGKTSFARGVLAGLGFEGEVPSPSYALVIPYERPAVSLALWHVDLYRIDDATEIDALALDDALHDAAMLIEWPERMGSRLWPQALKLRLTWEGEGRRLTVETPPSWEARCPFR